MSRPRSNTATARDLKAAAAGRPILIPGPKLAERRKAAGMTQLELSRLLGVTNSHLCGLESPRSGVRDLVLLHALDSVLPASPATQAAGGA